MRKLTFALAAIPLAVLAAACSTSGGDDSESSEAFQTDSELGTKALQILGAQRIDGARQQCNNCHDINQMTLRGWETSYKAALANINDPNKTAKQKVDAFRVEPGNPNAPYSASKLGFFAAAVHLTDLPEAPKVKAIFVQAFGATQAVEELKKFQKKVGMPKHAEPGDMLTKADFAIVREWADKGLPQLEQLMPETPRPATCEPFISDELKTHLTSMKTTGWTARNHDQQMPMFACTASGTPETCFSQKKDDGKDIFAEVETIEFAKTWKAAGTKMRMLHELPHASSFWSRNSADGRLVSAGGGEMGAFVVDLGKQLDTQGASSREIGIPAQYDPSFMPDNSGLLIQGASPTQSNNGGGGGEGNEGEGEGEGEFEGDHGGGDGTAFCTQDLFTNPSTDNVSLNESQCSLLGNVALYQSVGRRLADNALSDYFIVNNSFESDDGFGSDPVPSFGMDQKIEIKVMVSLGTEGGYKIGQTGKIDAPYEGDTMMSPTTMLTASRIAGEEKQQGYSIRKVVSTMGASGYTFEAKQVAKICEPGGKANFSFDERYLVTHHYLTREDFASDDDFAPYKDNAAADIFIYDLLTGEKLRVTHMKPGQLALFPHFRSDGWLYIHVRDRNTSKEYYVASDAVIGRP